MTYYIDSPGIFSSADIHLFIFVWQAYCISVIPISEKHLQDNPILHHTVCPYATLRSQQTLNNTNDIPLWLDKNIDLEFVTFVMKGTESPEMCAR